MAQQVRLANHDTPCSAVHWLPCSIAHTGAAPVASYFLTKPTGSIVDGREVHEAAFRGRQLRGACLALPEGFTGQVLCRQQPEPPSDETSVSWQATQCFSALHYWNHDAHPAAMDGVPRVLEWLAAAKAMAEPVSSEALAKEMQAVASSA